MTSLLARWPRGFTSGLMLAGLFALLSSPSDCRADDSAAAQKDNALLIYAGKLSHDHWFESFGPGTACRGQAGSIPASYLASASRMRRNCHRLRFQSKAKAID